jgi:MSHA biogenesis protein MshN
MLQDLDARGSTGAEALQVDVKPVAREERRLPLPLALGVLAGAVAIAAAGVAGWRYLHKPPAGASFAPRPAVVVIRPAPQVLPAAQVVAAPAAREEPGQRAVEQAVAPVAADAARALQFAAEQEAAAAPAPAPLKSKQAPRKLAHLEPEARAKKAPAPAAQVQVAAAAPLKVAAADGRQANGGRRGEDAYRRALASLQDGRVTETIASLEQALQLDPRHDAARQTLIGLLVETGRVDEAMRQLQQALAPDARQPALAMLLARLQIERGGSGIETLTRTLPYAGGNGEYMAFLAGALQRQGRHAEAAGQYQAALRGAPHNGVWWMGLGISLQADKRDADARTAFQRAQAAGSLTPELQAFVERKLQQLAR